MRRIILALLGLVAAARSELLQASGDGALVQRATFELQTTLEVTFPMQLLDWQLAAGVAAAECFFIPHV